VHHLILSLTPHPGSNFTLQQPDWLLTSPLPVLMDPSTAQHSC